MSGATANPIRASVTRCDAGCVEFSVSGGTALPGRLFFHFHPSLPAIPTSVLEAVACALLQRAMHEGQPLALDGCVDELLLDGLEEFQAAWAAWRPDLFTVIPVQPEEAQPIAGGDGDSGIVLALSGGLDSTAALVAHSPYADGRSRHQRLGQAVLVHGMDIPVEADTVFAEARRRAQRQADACGVQLTSVKTNWRAFCPEWEMGHVAGLAAVLHLVGSAVGARAGMIANDFRFGAMELPWSSNFITNPLLASSSLAVTGFGGGMTRVDKAALVASRPSVADDLRVCWQGRDLSRNCGECPKCTITALCFMAAGRPVPQGAGLRAPSVQEVADLPIAPGAQTIFAQDLRRPNALSAWMQEAIECALQKNADASPVGHRTVRIGRDSADVPAAARHEEAALREILSSRRYRATQRLLAPLDRLRAGMQRGTR